MKTYFAREMLAMAAIAGVLLPPEPPGDGMTNGKSAAKTCAA